jgi:hypothetical protein
MIKFICIALSAFTLFAFQNCSSLGSAPQHTMDAFSLAHNVDKVSNSHFALLSDTEFLNVESGDFKTDKDEQKVFFQIKFSKDGGQTYDFFPSDRYKFPIGISKVSYLWGTGSAASPQVMLVFASGKSKNPNEADKHFVFASDRRTPNWQLIDFSSIDTCSFTSGLYIQSNWYFYGSCGSHWAVIKANQMLTQFTTIDQITQNSSSGMINKMIQAKDGCLYAAGSMDTEAQTHQLIRKSCDLGTSWVTEYDHFVPKSDSNLVDLVEDAGNIYALGSIYDTVSAQTNLDFLKRDLTGQWQASLAFSNKAKSFVGRYLGLTSHCQFIAVGTTAGDRDPQVLKSSDCGSTWLPFSTVNGSFTSAKYVPSINEIMIVTVGLITTVTGIPL